MMNTAMNSRTAIPKGRRRLAAVVRAAGDIMRIADAERALGVTRSEASKLLSRWAAQGWLRRVGPGAYAPVGLDSLTSELVVDDSWVLVPVLFAPAYIGGRTAAEHWGLTEQIFRDCCRPDRTAGAPEDPAMPGRRFQPQAYSARHDLRHEDRLAWQHPGRRIGHSPHYRRHARRYASRRWDPACRRLLGDLLQPQGEGR